MSGNERSVVLSADPFLSDAVAAFEALNSVEGLGRWVLVGGAAVELQLETTHRETIDIDTLVRDKPSFRQQLIDKGIATLTADRTFQLSTGLPLDTIGIGPDDDLGTIKAAAQHWWMPYEANRYANLYAFENPARLNISLMESDRQHDPVPVSVASAGGLLAMKATVLPIRVDNENKQSKLANDAFDIFKLCEQIAPQTFADDLGAADPSFRTHLGSRLRTEFDTKADEHSRRILAQRSLYVPVDTLKEEILPVAEALESGPSLEQQSETNEMAERLRRISLESQKNGRANDLGHDF